MLWHQLHWQRCKPGSATSSLSIVNQNVAAAVDMDSGLVAVIDSERTMSIDLDIIPAKKSDGVMAIDTAPGVEVVSLDVEAAVNSDGVPELDSD